jgi:hypothetical protein
MEFSLGLTAIIDGGGDVVASDSGGSVQVYATAETHYSIIPHWSHESATLDFSVVIDSRGNIEATFPNGPTVLTSDGNAQVAITMNRTYDTTGKKVEINFEVGIANVASGGLSLSGPGITLTGSGGAANEKGSFNTLVYEIVE